eukprot:Hpha_TRINITY_DN19125_c0_g1::TRINITY_DN19125_c0_g1_i1::g.94742::m.94742
MSAQDADDGASSEVAALALSAVMSAASLGADVPPADDWDWTPEEEYVNRAFRKGVERRAATERLQETWRSQREKRGPRDRDAIRIEEESHERMRRKINRCITIAGCIAAQGTVEWLEQLYSLCEEGERPTKEHRAHLRTWRREYRMAVRIQSSYRGHSGRQDVARQVKDTHKPLKLSPDHVANPTERGAEAPFPVSPHTPGLEPLFSGLRPLRRSRSASPGAKFVSPRERGARTDISMSPYHLGASPPSSYSLTPYYQGITSPATRSTRGVAAGTDMPMSPVCSGSKDASPRMRGAACPLSPSNLSMSGSMVSSSPRPPVYPSALTTSSGSPDRPPRSVVSMRDLAASTALPISPMSISQGGAGYPRGVAEGPETPRCLTGSGHESG